MKTNCIFSSLLMMVMSLLFSSHANSQPKVIAHRGYWNAEGSAQNSIAALRKAAELGVYGSEFDVWVTKDGVAVLNHDPEIEGVVIEKSNYDDIKNLQIKNGETIPTLDAFLKVGEEYPDLKLILELKDHAKDENDEKALAEVIKAVRAYSRPVQIEFISFNLKMCQDFAKAFPQAEVAFLGGKLSPEKVKESGVNNIDYHYSNFTLHPTWVKEAHDLGMKVNVWTINSKKVLEEMCALGVDFVTTDKPEAWLEEIKTL